MDPAPSSPRLTLINPSNPHVSILRVRENRWNRYRVWKPLGLAVLAGATPSGWDISIIDENLGRPDYQVLPRPDVVGITAFTSQANRAYELAAHFRRLGVPVVMGGIHATTRTDEVLRHVDVAVTGEGETVWPRVLDDALRGSLLRLYDAGRADIDLIPAARHDLLGSGYAFGAVQTTRGCPLNCSFCSVTAVNGAEYRQRPIPDVVREFAQVRERGVLVVDDNLIGTAPEHLARAKELFRALIDADVRKEWIGQVTINFSDDEELMALATQAGCRGVFIGFESPSPEGLREVGKRFNLRGGRDFRASVRRIQRHGILVVGSFVMGLDVDGRGIGEQIARTAESYGLDDLNALFLTPLPGTRLWDQMEADGRILLHDFPADWSRYTLSFPVVRYAHLSTDEIIQEMRACSEHFYSLRRITWRIMGEAWGRRQPLRSLVSNLAFRKNARLSARAHARFLAAGSLPAPR